MHGDVIRAKFLDYFAQQDHKVVPSSAVVPAGDPTLLFTNAGMVQFKDVFLGTEERPYRRAVSSQKCVRAGGKHNDLENVGFTARHLTFFEMLGNFSFGDYFKAEAVHYAHQLLTEGFGLDPQLLWPTVFHADEPAFTLWQEVAGYPASRIIRLGEKDNFWAMGDTGPCGPCSEIVLDRGRELACGPECGIGQCDCDRWLELWNLVFMQFNREADGTLSPLPRPSVDTGMGLERLASVMQHKHTNFDTDLFLPIIQHLEEISQVRYQGEGAVFPFRVIADHVRTGTFVIADGVLPSNEGRGYVLRRILRRAVRYGQELGIRGAFLHRLVPTVVKIMGQAYPEVAAQAALVARAVAAEEERFLETLDTGMRVARGLVERSLQGDGPVFSGEDAFMLYDTFGFPLDLTRDLARENGLALDEAGFQRAMEQQRRRARAAQQSAAGDHSLLANLVQTEAPTPFAGYESLEEATCVGLMLAEDGPVEELTAESEGRVLLQASPFYGLGGGQLADQGWLAWPGGRARVTGVDQVAGRLVHRVQVVEGYLRSGQEVQACVDSARRWATARHHTATHLLHRALRQVLGQHVRQAGSLVTPDRLRFDFTHFQALTQGELRQVEDEVNAQILANLPVRAEWMDKEAAQELGAVALFGEKYGEKVRVVSSGLQHRELCGGTHVAATGEVGLCKLLSESSVGAGVRRLEAVCATSLLAYVRDLEGQLQELAETLATPWGSLGARAEQLTDELKTAQGELARLQAQSRRAQLGELAQRAEEVCGLPVLVAQVATAEAADLRRSGDLAKEQLGECVVVLAGAAGDRVLLLAMATPQAVAQGAHCGQLVQSIAPLVGGGGGGRPEMAQAGGRQLQGVEPALERARQLVREQLGGEPGE